MTTFVRWYHLPYFAYLCKTKKTDLSFSRYFFKKTYSLIQQNISNEKRIGVLAVLISERDSVNFVNSLLSQYADLIFARQGLPFRKKNLFIISLIVEGLPDQINQLSGRLGKLDGVESKVMFAKSAAKAEDLLQ